MTNATQDGSRARPAAAFVVALASCAVALASGSSCSGEGGVTTYTAIHPSTVGGGAPVVATCVDAGTVAFVGDGCFGGGSNASTTYVPSGCSVQMKWSTGACTGTLTGPANAFDGGCQANSAPSTVLACNGNTFPGRLTCTNPGLPSCNISFCTLSSCPP